MAFHITHRNGAMEHDPPVSSFVELLREVNAPPRDPEHPDVSVTHESEWCISVFREGYATFENLESGGERHMRGLSEKKILELWGLLAQGDIQAIESEPWRPGYK